MSLRFYDLKTQFLELKVMTCLGMDSLAPVGFLASIETSGGVLVVLVVMKLRLTEL